MTWETIIGLEVHVQLKTRTKLFSGTANAYGAEPNTQANVIDLAMPGVLPVLNSEAVRMAIKLGLGINAKVANTSVFARKNYFYPDLPKGYQITQFEHPIVQGGYLDIIVDNQIKRVRIERAHLEEDTGKSLHEGLPGQTGLDLNRAGTPLIEIVSAPDMRSPKEVTTYLKALQILVRYLDISDANMQEGSFRCDANVSVKPVEQQELGTRCEVKNLNSFRFIEKAIEFEVKRQIEVLTSGGKIEQETRLYDANRDETRSMRSKEEARDYRYFPDPDLLPLTFSDEYVEEIRSSLPELPQQKTARFQKDYGLSTYDASILVATKELADYFEDVVKYTKGTPKLAANWILGDVSAKLNEHNLVITEASVDAKQLAKLIDKIVDSTISGKIAKEVFLAMWEKDGGADEIIAKRGLQQIANTSELEDMIKQVLANNPQQLQAYKAGKEQLFGFFVGQVMKASQGKANPELVNTLLRKIVVTL